MKKNMFAIALLLMTALLFTACGSTPADSTDPTPADTAAIATPAASTDPVASTEPTATPDASTDPATVPGDTDYLAWTSAEWSAADADQKFQAIKAVMIAAQPVLEGSPDEAFEPVNDVMVTLIDTLFTAEPTFTLGEFTDAIKEAMPAE